MSPPSLDIRNPLLRFCLGLVICLAATPVVRSQIPSAASANRGLIDGVIVSARTGQPLSNATVSISGVDGRLPLAETISDAQGRFSFPRVADGKYSLRVSHRGYIAEAFEEHGTGTTSIVTGPGLISTGIQFMLKPQSTIYGTIAEDSGDPVEQGRITLYRLNNGGAQGGAPVRAQQTQTDEDGSFEIAGLAPGKYYLAVSAKPWYATQGQSVFSVLRSVEISTGSGHPHSPLDVAYPTTYYPDVTDSAYAAAIEVAGGERIPINLTLHPVPSVHVSMQFPTTPGGPSGMPMLRQSIFGFPDTVQTSINIMTPDPQSNTAGVTTVDISGFAPGQYELAVVGNNDEANRETQVNLSSDQSIDLSSTTPLAVISGKVTRADADQKPGQNKSPGIGSNSSSPEEAGSSLSLLLTSEEGENHFSAPIGGHGSFRIPGIAPGTYDLSVHEGNDPLAIAQLTVTGATVEGNQIKINSDPVTISARVSASTTTIHGFAKLAGKATAGVFLELIPMAASGPAVRSAALQTNQSDSDGSFDFPKVLPGSYTLVAIQEGWTLDLNNPDAMRPYLARGLRITVPPRSRDIVLKDSVEVQPK